MRRRPLTDPVRLTGCYSICSIPLSLTSIYPTCIEGCRFCQRGFRMSKAYDRVRQDLIGKYPGGFEEYLHHLDETLYGTRSKVRKQRDCAEKRALITRKVPLRYVFDEVLGRMEEREGRFRRVLEVLAKHEHPVVVTTRGRLFAEEPYLSLLKASHSSISVSFVTLDERRWRATEGPLTVHPQRRLEALSKATAAGLPATVRLQPIVVGLTDGEDLEKVTSAVGERGAIHVLAVWFGGWATLVERMCAAGGGDPTAIRRAMRVPEQRFLHNSRSLRPEYLVEKLTVVRRVCREHGMTLGHYPTSSAGWMSETTACCGVDRIYPRDRLFNLHAGIVLEAQREKGRPLTPQEIGGLTRGHWAPSKKVRLNFRRVARRARHLVPPRRASAPNVDLAKVDVIPLTRKRPTMTEIAPILEGKPNMTHQTEIAHYVGEAVRSANAEALVPKQGQARSPLRIGQDRSGTSVSPFTYKIRYPPVRRSPVEKHSFKTLMSRLSAAGFKSDFVQPAILPDWWDGSCQKDPNLLPDIEVRVARFFGLPVSVVRNPAVNLSAPAYAGAHLRRIRDTEQSRLTPSIHSAIQIAAAVARSLHDAVPQADPPPTDGLAWRAQIQRSGEAVKLDDLLSDLWRRGIPVVPVDVLPAPSFQGLAGIVEGRPVVLLGHKHDEPGRVAFVVAHEIGHIASGDCEANCPVVDGEEEIVDDTDLERLADRYATRVLVGDTSIPEIQGDEAKALAAKAMLIEQDTGIDAGAVIFAWARNTGDFVKAQMAVKALYRAVGARRLLREHFDRNVDVESATDSDRALLRCVLGEPERDAVAG